jgi:hypothetical protein
VKVDCLNQICLDIQIDYLIIHEFMNIRFERNLVSFSEFRFQFAKNMMVDVEIFFFVFLTHMNLHCEILSHFRDIY